MLALISSRCRRPRGDTARDLARLVAQQDAAYAELTSAPTSRRRGQRTVARRSAPPRRLLLETSHRRADVLDGMEALLKAHSTTVTAVFSGIVPKGFDGQRRAVLAERRAEREGHRAGHGRSRGRRERVRLHQAPGHRRAGAVRLPGHDVRHLPGAGPPRRQGRRLRRHGDHAGRRRRAHLQDQALRLRATRSRSRPRASCSPARTTRTTASSAWPSSPQKHNPELAQVAKSVAAGKSGQVETVDPWTGKHVVLTWSKIDAAGWSFLTSVPVDEVLAPVKSLQTTLFLVGLIALIAARRC